MSRNTISIAVVFCLLQLTTFRAFAASEDITGNWVGNATVGGSNFPHSIDFLQSGGNISGSEPTTNSAFCTVSGTIDSTTLIFRVSCPTNNYFYDVNAGVDGLTITGSFTDSEGTSGTLSLNKMEVASVLNPKTSLVAPPAVNVKGRTAQFKLKKFKKISLKKLSLAPAHRSARAARLTVQYQVELKGPSRAKILSARNSCTAKNLKPGAYSVTYRVSALSDGRKQFTTKPSPVSRFTVN